MSDITSRIQTANRHILFVFSGPPKQGTGSQVIVDRHLRRLTEDGWKVSVVAPEGTLVGETFPDSWQIIPLPMRRWWWSPFRPEIPGFLQLRLMDWQRECEYYLGKERPDAIITVLWGVYALLSAYLSRKWRVPLSVMIHDQQEFWATSEKEYQLMRQISMGTLKQAARVWPVCHELGEIYQTKKNSNISVLFPICEGDRHRTGWNDSFATHPVVGHAGSLHSFQIPNLQQIALALEEVNGTLLLVTEPNNPVLLKLLDECSNVKYREPFAKNADAIAFLAENASCILVSYSFDLNQQPWGATSFPSKLVEFCHLGLPIILFSPPETASSNWARNYKWLGYVDSLNREKILNVLHLIKEKETWLKMADQSRIIAAKEFSPDTIHRQFECELAVGTK